jgi:putative sigma-54 modulation protein
MYLTIQGRHLTVTPSIHEYVKNKLKKIKFYFDQIVHAHVVISVVKNTQTAEATITVERTHFHNKVNSEDLYKSIDTLFDKLERQVSKHKESHEGHAKHGVDKRKNHDEEVTAVHAENKNVIEDIEISDKPMGDLEAVLQLKADSRLKHFGYYTTHLSERPSFIHQVDESHYLIYYYDGHWEKKEVELVHPDRLQVNAIESIKISSESLEHAMDYLDHHPDECRLFRSVQSKTILFMYRIKPGHFGALRELVRA